MSPKERPMPDNPPNESPAVPGGDKSGQLMSISLITASIVVVAGGIHAIRGLLTPILMATFFALILLIPFNWLRSKLRLSRVLALIVVILLTFIISLLTVGTLANQLAQFTDRLPEYHERLEQRLLSLPIHLEEYIPIKLPRRPDTEPEESSRPAPAARSGVRPVVFLHRSDRSAPSAKTPRLLSLLDEPAPTGTQVPAGSLTPAESAIQITPPEPIKAETTLTVPDSSELQGAAGKKLTTRLGATSEDAVRSGSYMLFGFLKAFSGEIAQLASNTLVIMILVIFMLLESFHLPDKITLALASRDFETSAKIRDLKNKIQHYFIIKTKVSLITGLLSTIVLTILGVQYPLLWGILAFLLNYIPNIGPIVAAIPPLILATVDSGITDGVLVAVGMIGIHIVMGYFFEPRWLGRGLDLSALVVLLSLFVSGWFLGLAGVFLAPPLAVICKIILGAFPETEWIAVLMSDGVPESGQE